MERGKHLKGEMAVQISCLFKIYKNIYLKFFPNKNVK